VGLADFQQRSLEPSVAKIPEGQDHHSIDTALGYLHAVRVLKVDITARGRLYMDNMEAKKVVSLCSIGSGMME